MWRKMLAVMMVGWVVVVGLGRISEVLGSGVDNMSESDTCDVGAAHSVTLISSDKQ